MIPEDHDSLNLTFWTGPTSHNVMSALLRATQGSRPALTNIGAASHIRYLIIDFNEILFPHYSHTWPWL